MNSATMAEDDDDKMVDWCCGLADHLTVENRANLTKPELEQLEDEMGDKV